MKTAPLVVGLDPGFASIGWAVMELTSKGANVIALGVIRTQKADKKHAVYASDDNVARARLIVGELTGIITPRVRALCVEAMSYPRNASSAMKMGICWGVVSAVRSDLPMVQATPQQLKLAVAGKRTASKDEVQAALRRIYPGQLDVLMARLPQTLHEHAADAVAAVTACLESDVIRAIKPGAW